VSSPQRFTVDAFTDQPFAGKPAAVCVRGGTVRVRLEESRAQLGGNAVTVLRGELLH
jgi:predicted PhzF superfamily epimerase YddE/YHI9